MQVEVDGEWVNVDRVGDFTFTNESTPDPEPVTLPTSYTFTTSFKTSEGGRGLVEQLLAEARAARAARRMWLRFPVAWRRRCSAGWPL